MPYVKPSFPFLHRPHPHADQLAWGAVPGNIAEDILYSTNGVNGAGVTFRATGDYGYCVDSSAQTASGISWARPTLTLGTSYTITAVCKLDTVTAGSGQQKIVCIPYRNDASWATPFAALGFYNFAATGTGRWGFEYAQNSTTGVSVVGTADNYFDLTWRIYTIVRAGASVTAYRDGVQHSTGTLGTNVAPDLSGGAPVNLLCRNRLNPGNEGADGQIAGAWIHAYAMDATTVRRWHARIWDHVTLDRPLLSAMIPAPVVTPNATPAIGGAKLIPSLRQLAGGRVVAGAGQVGGSKLVVSPGVIGGGKVIP